MKHFIPVSKPLKFPIGVMGELITQIEFYEKLTNKKCDFGEIAAVTEPVILNAKKDRKELCDIIANCAFY